jgi:hypothetical protein
VSTAAGCSGNSGAQIVRQRGKVAPPMNCRLPWFVLAAALTAVGCTPDIGASCTTSINCSQMGDRACDTTMPGGYCTIFNCEPDTCPSEAACIAFREVPSAVSACQDPNDTRMLRTFCMVKCSDNGDCRTGYVCADLNAPGNPWGASLADRDNHDARVCTVPGAAPQGANQPSGYCQSNSLDAGLPAPYVHPDAASSDAGQAEDASTPSDQ